MKKINVDREYGAGEVIEANVANTRIVAEHVEKVYATRKTSVTAIEDVNIKVNDNEFVCLVGPSGCGKSTVLRMLAGLDFPTGGKIQIDGRDITGPGADRGMVFQSYTLFPWMTVEDNIKFGLKLKKMDKKAMQEIADKYLDIIGLTNFRKSYPKELSGGMKQRVAIARALAASPEVLLMDEPFGALDPQTKESMQLLLRTIWQKEKTTVIFVTHDIEEAVFLASKIYVMTARPGRVREEVDVYLPYNRTLDLKDTPEFIKIRRHIAALLHPEGIGTQPPEAENA